MLEIAKSCQFDDLCPILKRIFSQNPIEVDGIEVDAVNKKLAHHLACDFDQLVNCRRRGNCLIDENNLDAFRAYLDSEDDDIEL